MAKKHSKPANAGYSTKRPADSWSVPESIWNSSTGSIIARLDYWALLPAVFGTTPSNGYVLAGIVHDHPSLPNGSWIRTSRALNARGRIVNCKSRQYYLGKPDPKYLNWLERQHIAFDPDNPVQSRLP